MAEDKDAYYRRNGKYINRVSSITWHTVKRVSAHHLTAEDKDAYYHRNGKNINRVSSIAWHTVKLHNDGPLSSKIGYVRCWPTQWNSAGRRWSLLRLDLLDPAPGLPVESPP